MAGEAARYYNSDQVFQDPRPAPQPQPQYANNGQNDGNHYQPVEESKPPPPYPSGEVQQGTDFNQAFRIERPQFHDVWAGLLVSVSILAPSWNQSYV
jgi:hypothetical protein